MSKSLFITLGAVLFACLYAVQWNVYRPRIERDLTRRTQAALENQPYQVTATRFSGRDGEIHITTENPQATHDASQLARKVFGVRVARVIAQEQHKPAASLRIERTGENVRLQGTVPSPAIVSLYKDAAETAFAGMQIQNDLIVGSVADAAYLRGLRTMVGLLVHTAPEGTLVLEGTQLTLSGEVPDTAAASNLEARARERLPQGLDLTVRLLPAQTTPERQVAKDFRKEIESTVLLFPFNSAEIAQETAYLVEPLIEMAKGQQQGVRIVGHADSKGSDSYNHRLSVRRAQHVAALFKQQGVQTKIETEGRGESQPAADNSTAEGRAKNRRVEFQILGGG